MTDVGPINGDHNPRGVQVNDDLDVEQEYGFAPAASMTGGPAVRAAGITDTAANGATGRTSDPTRPGGRRGTGLRRRLSAVAILVAALGSMGGAYAAFAASSGAASTTTDAVSAQEGHLLYETSCVTCHGANLEGVKGNGPALVGVGSAAVYFQVSTGRMPLVAQGAYAERKEAKFSELQVLQLGAFVQSVGGGPQVPMGHLQASTSTLGNGGELYRLNCASCHGTTFKGAPLSAGKVAPSLNKATDRQIYTAMLSGPESMPVFSNTTITPAQKKEIIGYVQTLKASADPGGNGIDRIGPVSEAIVIWVGGVGVLMLFILWIGARAR